MFIKITSVVKGSPCESRWSSEDRQEISMEWAQKQGLFKNHRWMSNIRVGETLVVNTDIAKMLPEISTGNFTYEELTAKYMNQTLYSDTNAFEVVEWITPKKAMLRELKPIFQDGEVHESTDEFEQDTESPIFEVRMRKNGGFYQTGQKCCPYIPTEHPHYYYDLSF